MQRLDTFVDRLPSEVGCSQELELRGPAVVSRGEAEERRLRGATGEDDLVDSETSKLRPEMTAPGGPHEAGGTTVGYLQRRIAVEKRPQSGHDPSPAQQAEVHHQRCGRGVGIINIDVAQEFGCPGDTAQCVFEIPCLDRFEAHRFVGEIHVIPVDHHRGDRKQVTVLHEGSSFLSVRAS